MKLKDLRANEKSFDNLDLKREGKFELISNTIDNLL